MEQLIMIISLTFFLLIIFIFVFVYFFWFDSLSLFQNAGVKMIFFKQKILFGKTWLDWPVFRYFKILAFQNFLRNQQWKLFPQPERFEVKTKFWSILGIFYILDRSIRFCAQWALTLEMQYVMYFALLFFFQ